MQMSELGEGVFFFFPMMNASRPWWLGVWERGEKVKAQHAFPGSLC